MKVLGIILLFISPLYAKESLVNRIVCEFSPHTIKTMTSMSSEQYQQYILENIANAEDVEDISFMDIEKKAKEAFTAKNKKYLNYYTPYALQNIVIQAAIEKDKEMFSHTLKLSLHLCSDFFVKQNSLCAGEKLYTIAKQDRESVCGNFGITSSMQKVCGDMALIADQQEIFWEDARPVILGLASIGYFEKAQTAPKRMAVQSAGMVLANSMALLLGGGTEQVISAIDIANEELESGNARKHYENIITACKSGKLSNIKQFVAN